MPVRENGAERICTSTIVKVKVGFCHLKRALKSFTGVSRRANASHLLDVSNAPMQDKTDETRRDETRRDERRETRDEARQDKTRQGKA